MSSCGAGLRVKTRFGTLVEQVLSLDPSIEWVAVEAGRELRWAWRDHGTGRMRTGTTRNDSQLADPLLLMVAQGGDALSGESTTASPHRLQFVVLAYVDIVQIVARLGAYAHVSVAVPPGGDANALGTKLTRLLDRFTQVPINLDANANLSA